MRLQTGQHMEQKQTHALAPALYRSMHILAMGPKELSEMLAQKLEHNPLLVSSSSSSAEHRDDYDRGYDGEGSSERGSQHDSGVLSTDEVLEATLEAPIYLADHLKEQIGSLHIDATLARLASKLAENLDEHGFWTAEPEALAETKAEQALLGKAIDLINSLDPIGCGVANSQTSLKVQVAHADYDTRTKAALEELIDAIFAATSREELPDEINGTPTDELLELISSHELYPASGFRGGSAPVYIYPDIIIKKIEDSSEDSEAFDIAIGAELIPSLRIELPDELNMQSDSNQVLSSYIQEAQELIDAVERRNKSLKALALALLEVQHDFFSYGPSYLKAYTQREMASKLKVHEATISRLVRDKYIDSPWGIYPLKKMFPAQVCSGSYLSKERIQSMIRDIRQEAMLMGKRLSDEKVRQELEGRGIKIARRTIAKYRLEEQS